MWKLMCKYTHECVALVVNRNFMRIKKEHEDQNMQEVNTVC